MPVLRTLPEPIQPHVSFTPRRGEVNPSGEVGLGGTQVPERTWDMALPTHGRYRVTGRAGSGVSSFLVDVALQRVRAGADPDGIAFVAPSKESAARLRQDFNLRLLTGPREAGQAGYVASAPAVRSVHSLAFALLRRHEDEDIRLISGAEQDGVMRELLAGQEAAGGLLWPESVRPALGYLGFARQLRDVLLRAIERQLSPEDLEELGRRFDRPLWTAAGGFLREYEQTMALAGTRQYSASELMARVLEVELGQPFHTLLVDEAQLLDPTSAAFLDTIMPAGPASLVVIGGDPDQAVFHFRGADADFLTGFNGEHIDLGASRQTAAARIAVCEDAATQGIVVADTLRRAHLLDGVAWSDMAVIVRSTSTLTAMNRVLLANGVPVHVSGTDLILSEQRIVTALLLGLKAIGNRLSLSELGDLVIGPVGGADPVTLRRLVRGLRRFDPATSGMETLRLVVDPREELPDFGAVLGERELTIITRMRAVTTAGREAVDAGGSIEEVLWAVWEATGLSNRLMTAALRGGASGSQAGRDLDAVMALFDAAGDYVERHPGTSSIDSFVQFIEEQELPTGVRDRRTAKPEAVSLLTAHGAMGMHWGVVVVAGVQEDEWPSLGETGSLFEQEALLDWLDRGIAPGTPVSHGAERLVEERRLFHVATTRAATALLITAVDNAEGAQPTEPSRFLEEFAKANDCPQMRVSGGQVDAQASAQGAEVGAQAGAEGEAVQGVRARILSDSGLVSELRRVVCDEAARDDERAQAARQLARLAQVGVAGADPEQWASATVASTQEALPRNTRLSPSKIEGVVACPLKAVLGNLEDEEEDALAMTRGTIAHSFCEAIGRGVDPEYARLAAMDAYRSILREPEWRSATLCVAFEETLARAQKWIALHQGFDLVGVEVGVDVNVTEEVSIRGRIDRLEATDAGAYHIYDFKTGKSPVTGPEAKKHLQLAAYQLALSRGRLEGDAITTVPAGAPPIEVDGGTLVYPAVKKGESCATRDQAHLDEDGLAELLAILPGVIEDQRGPELKARENKYCTTCNLRHICPIQPEGAVMTDE